jgi:septal ring-binding cell division protein DamX
VTLVDGATLRERSRVSGGAADYWHVVTWNGFRPRAAGLDKPVEFRTDTPVADTAVVDSAAADTTAPPDTTRRTPPDTVAVPQAPAPAPLVVTASAGEVVPEAPRDRGAAVQTRRRRWTVQFAAVETAREARRVAARIKLKGTPLRIVPATRAGKPWWLVVAGPFPTRAAAERVGRASNHDYWTYEGAP